MAGGRFGSSIVYPYTTSKVWENQCSAAAGISVTGTSLTGDTFCASVTLSDQNICATCCTSLGTLSYDYNEAVNVYYICDAYRGTLCYSQNTCNCFRRLGYADSNNVTTEPSGVYSGYFAYYTPVPYLSPSVIPNAACSGSCNIVGMIPLCSSCVAYVNVRCLETAGGCVPYSCPLKNLIGSCAAVPCICCDFLDTTGTVGYAYYNPGCINMYAVDYWGRQKAIYMVGPNWYSCVVYLCTDPSGLYITCCNPASKNCCSCVCCTCTLYTCWTATACVQCARNSTQYPCEDRWLAQRIIVSGCRIIGFTGLATGWSGLSTTGFRTICDSSNSSSPIDSTCTVSNYKLQYMYPCDTTAPIRWMLYDNKTSTNKFMWWHANTPDWNGIYKISQSQWNCIHSISYNYSCCLTYPEGFCTAYFTKIADVPAAWCTIGSYDFTTTTPVAINDTEFMVRVGHLDDGLTGNMTRYTTTDFITWTPTNEQYFGVCLSSNTAVIGKTTHTQYVVNNFKNLDAAGTVESCTTSVNFERTGIVIGDGDAVYVTNHTGVPTAFSVWGYTE